MKPSINRFLPALAVILIAYLALGAAYALRTPAWQAPDEPAHYQYVAQLAARGCCPVIESGDWDQTYLSQLTGSRFAPEALARLDTVQYEDHQPPLYYALQAVVYTLTGGSLTAMRLLSVALGAGVVVCAFAVGRILVPERPQIALGAAAFVAFLPQHLAILGSVNNDALAELFIAATLVMTLRYLVEKKGAAWVLGLLVGLIFLTKTTGYFMAAVVALAIVLRWRLDTPQPVSRLIGAWTAFLVPALALGGVWWGRNLLVYGGTDFMGLAAHDAVVVGQPRTTDWIANMGTGGYLQSAFTTTFNSFWGQFGWMALPLPGWAYMLILALVAVVVSGLLIDRFVLRRALPSPPEKLAAWGVIGTVVVLTFAQYVYYNLNFVQHQGRYLYPALIPFALWVALGLDAWRALLFARLSVPFARWLALAALALLVPLNLYLLWRVIPLLAP